MPTVPTNQQQFIGKRYTRPAFAGDKEAYLDMRVLPLPWGTPYERETMREVIEGFSVAVGQPAQVQCVIIPKPST